MSALPLPHNRRRRYRLDTLSSSALLDGQCRLSKTLARRFISHCRSLIRSGNHLPQPYVRKNISPACCLIRAALSDTHNAASAGCPISADISGPYTPPWREQRSFRCGLCDERRRAPGTGSRRAQAKGRHPKWLKPSLFGRHERRTRGRRASKDNAHGRLGGSPVSPTSPTFTTLNDQLNKSHRRIRELEARETELLAENRTLCAAIFVLTSNSIADSSSDLDCR